MPRLLIRDEDLHRYWMHPEIWDTVRWLSDTFQAVLDPAWAGNAVRLLHFAGEDPAGAAPEEVIETLYRLCPDNLAERLHGALNLYRAVGQWAWPGLLPLAHRLLQAELLLYVRLKKEGKPYRDHLAHQTRVAALAHLLLTQPGLLTLEGAPLWPEELHTEKILARWRETWEFHLLRRFALRRRLDLPDPERDGEAWKPILGTAALLAGLVHDIGYVQKSLSEVADPVAGTFESLRFLPDVEGLKGLQDTPLEEFYRQIVEASGPCQTYADPATYLTVQHRELHSLVGAFWLAQFEQESSRTFALWADVEEGTAEHRARSHLLLALHLGSLLALAHDLALTDDERQARLGLRERPGKENQSVLNFDDFPFCTLFALADVLQEFGRLMRVVEKDTVRFIAPLGALGLRRTEDADAVARLRRARLWNHRADREPALLLSFGTRDSRPRSLLPKEVLRLREASEWKEDKVGDKLPAWLHATGLDRYVALDGQPNGVEWIDKRYRLLCELQRDLASLPGSEAAAERHAVENEGQTLARLLGTNRVNLERRVREVARDPRSPLRLRVLPVFDLNEPDHEFLYDEP